MTRYVGRYEVLEELGAGGMGVVYRARDRNTNQSVALKQLLVSSAEGNNRAREALLEREYHSLVRLKHPRIIEVYDYGLNEQGPWYTMELLGGADLQHLSPLPFRKACEHLRDVASSLALMHSHRLLHRDVTPRNVRLTADGHAEADRLWRALELRYIPTNLRHAALHGARGIAAASAQSAHGPVCARSSRLLGPDGTARLPCTPCAGALDSLADATAAPFTVCSRHSARARPSRALSTQPRRPRPPSERGSLESKR